MGFSDATSNLKYGLKSSIFWHVFLRRERERERERERMEVVNVLVRHPWPPRLSSIYKYQQQQQQNLSFSLSPLSSKHSKPLSQMPLSTSPSSKSSFLPSNHSSSWLQHTSVYHDTVTSNGHRLGLLHSVFPTSPAVVSSVQDLFDFICAGPLVEKLGLSPNEVSVSIDRWLECGLYLCRLFRFSELNLTTPQKARLYHYYIPVFFWCEDQISHHKSKFKDGDEVPPLVIGFSAPQGSGKTTLVFALEYLFRITGRKPATISIDDFYLTYEDQAKLRNENPGNSLLELRGNAGSHDLQFSIDTLTELKKLTKEGLTMKVPRYDKSAYGGKGDRADPSTWPEVEGPLEVILFEGWMLGFKPIPNEVVNAVDPQLEVVNQNLEAYYDAWDKFIEAWIVIKIKDPSCVFQWRLQVLDFVSRYLPAYKAYLPTLYSEGPNGSDPERLLIVEVDEERNPILGS